ncbi:hypothetical protein RD110_09410 [Rhodoferax koreense]|uniref:Ice-binding protein C-terminal domain-containing protein n=1 Tax=Rhodoferax koreensis TaxID=1842727 RepID=A0A1P8JUG8_9BURK|nr:PEP-CTERM sorting domain-containing protein [Rhodoferax koreense]APW37378.1 hypothetical protein RD110_09410 [Rhodoferax koreense]
MRKLLFSAIFAVGAGLAGGAQAYQVSYNYTNTNVPGGDQSGKTSPFLTAANVAVPGSGIFIETFGARNGGGNAQGCGLDTPAGLVSLSGGSYAFRSGTVAGVAAAPAGDSTCYAYGPSQGGSLPDVVNVNYSGLLSQLGAGASLNYLGLYYGSIDTYNDLLFYNAQGGLIATVTGASLIDQFKGTSGNQQADSSNIYVNLFFEPGEQFTSFSFRTTGIAFEMDNVSVGFNVAPPSQVPEPGSLALLGLGIAAIGLTRRRKRSV